MTVMGSMWLLQGLCDSYGIYVAVTGSICDSYGICMAVTGSM